VLLADGRVTGLVTMTDLRQALPWRGLARNASGERAVAVLAADARLGIIADMLPGRTWPVSR
jgi:hypothetical protein